MITDNIAKATNWNIYSEIKTGALGGSTWHRKSTCSMASSVNMLFFGIVCLIACTLCRAADDDKCQSFAGGSVFPQETRRTSGHAIQWSQAVSKFCIQRASFPVLGLSWNLITVYESQPLCQLFIFMALFLFAESFSFGVCFLGQCQCLSEIYLFLPTAPLICIPHCNFIKHAHL